MQEGVLTRGAGMSFSGGIIGILVQSLGSIWRVFTILNTPDVLF